MCILHAQFAMAAGGVWRIKYQNLQVCLLLQQLTRREGSFKSFVLDKQCEPRLVQLKFMYRTVNPLEVLLMSR
jgi:hypothetical protein